MAKSDQIKSTYYCAIDYTVNGFSVIPLKPKSKQPSIASWKPFTISPHSKKQLETWYVNTDNNIAIITGGVSSIFAIDIDGLDIYNFFIKKIDSLAAVDEQLVQSELFEWKTFLNQKCPNNEFSSLNHIQLLTYIKLAICTYAINYTIMTVTLFYCYYIINYI
ncbi:MAG TPA: bifunctional DNA primase/polymerase [Nitrososphaeraceae archaeon]|nr:bifunctional DNA primase/polymerase [Nitrososphaeraceae archaeon]